MFPGSYELGLEVGLAREIQQLQSDRLKVFDGITDRPIRMKRFRRVILKLDLQGVNVGKSAETYSQYFERLYGESLRPKTQRKSHAQIG